MRQIDNSQGGNEREEGRESRVGDSATHLKIECVQEGAMLAERSECAVADALAMAHFECVQLTECGAWRRLFVIG